MNLKNFYSIFTCGICVYLVLEIVAIFQRYINSYGLNMLVLKVFTFFIKL